MSQCKCLRCGHTWWPRAKRIFSQGGRNGHHLEYLEAESKRCAKCRSAYWNKMYVRQNSNRAPGSIGYQAPLPFISEAPALVRSKHDLEWWNQFSPRTQIKFAAMTYGEADEHAEKILSAGIKKISHPKSALVGARKKALTRQRRRAADTRANFKHGKTKGKKCNSK
jgi:hypothetical protein